eukprot:g142.t1
MDLARRLAVEDRDRVMDGDVKNWHPDRIRAFVASRDDLPSAAQAALQNCLSSGIELLRGGLASTPERMRRKLAAMLGVAGLGAEGWQEALAASGAAELGNCAQLGPDYVSAILLDEDIMELEEDAEAWLSELEDQGMEGVDAESALKVKAKVAEIDAAARVQAEMLAPAVERMISDAQARQREYNRDHRRAEVALVEARRGCDLLPRLWPLVHGGKLQEAVKEIEGAIEAQYRDKSGEGGQVLRSNYAADIIVRTYAVDDEAMGEQGRCDPSLPAGSDGAGEGEGEGEGESKSDAGGDGSGVDGDLGGGNNLTGDGAGEGEGEGEGESKSDAGGDGSGVDGDLGGGNNLTLILDELIEQTIISTEDPSRLPDPFETLCPEDFLKGAAKRPTSSPKRASTADWGAAYRSQLEMPETTISERSCKYQLLSTTSQNFIDDVAMVGKRIIEEIFIPLSSYADLTFKPSVGMGGIAGGQKYIINGILYKLASAADEGSPYGGSFEAANKAAAHDLRGATALSNAVEAIKAREPDAALPHITLNALVDYLGFRLQAMPLLPLGPASLKLGSNNAGDTVKGESQELAAMFEQLAAELGMAPHRVLPNKDKTEKKACQAKLHGLTEKTKGDKSRASGTDEAIQKIKAELAAFNDKEVTVSFGLDVEGHLDREGRPVGLDFARVFSPEDIRETTHLAIDMPGTIFVRHLRPEFIKAFADSKEGKPLSADALSMFASGASDSAEMNERVKRATKFLLKIAIPDCARELDKTRPVKQGSSISEFLHHRGINVRHMGLVYHHCVNDEARTALLAEMVARTIKNLMRHAAREAVIRTGRANIAVVRLLYSDMLSFACMSHGMMTAEGFRYSERFWTCDVWDGLRRRFGDRSGDIRSKLREAVLPNLGAVKQFARRIAAMLGLVFSDECKEALQDDPGRDEKSTGFLFTVSDIKAIDVRVKHMTVTDRAAGKILVFTQEQLAKVCAGDANTSQHVIRIATAAKKRFEAVLRSAPRDEAASKAVEKLGKLTRVKEVMDRLIRFDEGTRKSEALMQMRDETDVWQSGKMTVIDLRDAPAGGNPDIDRWWIDLIELVLHDEKFEKVTHFRNGPSRDAHGGSYGGLGGCFL